MSLVPKVLAPGDVQALQANLTQVVAQTDNAVQGCAALSAVTKKNWGDFRDTVNGYATVKVDGAGIDYATSLLAPLWTGASLRDLFGSSTDEFYQRGRQYEQEVVDWQKIVTDAGCPLDGPGHTPLKDDNQLGDLLKWGAIAVAAVAGAYGVSKLVEVAAPVIQYELAKQRKKVSK